MHMYLPPICRSGSERDLIWYTWHFWYNIFVAAFSIETAEGAKVRSCGAPAQLLLARYCLLLHLVPTSLLLLQLPPLPGAAPVDYVPPGCKARPGR